MTESPVVVAVDWSGCRTDDRGTWVATAVEDALTDVRPATRTGAIDYVLDLALTGRPLVVGLDFNFSFPRWVTAFIGEPPAIWEAVADHGEDWLADCVPPFWGRAGSRRPATVELFRRTERNLRDAGWAPKSVFQIAGSGAVGTGSIRGMPHLSRLEREGFGVWPFAGGCPRVVEIYPRVLTGPVNKRSAEARAAHIARRYPHLPAALARVAASNEDAFDAAVSALAMAAGAEELVGLAPSTEDPVTRAEGEVWLPAGVRRITYVGPTR